MTLSKDKLLSNQDLALQRLAPHCIEKAIGDYHNFGLGDYQDILPTTWKELEDAGCIRPIAGGFRITNSGWIKLLEATGELCSGDMKRKLGLVAKELKDCLDGRSQPGMIQPHVIANKTGLPQYWIVNVIHTHLIRRCLDQVDADWPSGDTSETRIEIPINVGHPLMSYLKVLANEISRAIDENLSAKGVRCVAAHVDSTVQHPEIVCKISWREGNQAVLENHPELVAADWAAPLVVKILEILQGAHAEQKINVVFEDFPKPSVGITAAGSHGNVKMRIGVIYQLPNYIYSLGVRVVSAGTPPSTDAI